jgi:hypothetical protein
MLYLQKKERKSLNTNLYLHEKLMNPRTPIWITIVVLGLLWFELKIPDKYVQVLAPRIYECALFRNKTLQM